MKTLYFVWIACCLIAVAGCEEPLGPPLGLGPGLDQAAWIVLLVVAIGFLWRPVRSLISRWLKPAGTPEDILKTRYAQGEITEEQYLRMSQTLAQSQGRSS